MDWAARKRAWVERAHLEFQKWLDTGKSQYPLGGFEPCPLCCRWYGHHYHHGGCRSRGLPLLEPWPYARELSILARLLGEPYDLHFYDQHIEEIREHGIPDYIAVQAEQVTESKVEDRGAEPEPGA